MAYLIWPGAILSLFGVMGIVWCITLAIKAKSSGLSDEDLRARLQKIVAINLAALFISALGLMLVVVGIILS